MSTEPKSENRAGWRKGDFVELDGLLAVITGVLGEPGVPDEHVALWFGDPRGKRKSEGGLGGNRPEIWTVPEALCVAAAEPLVKH